MADAKCVLIHDNFQNFKSYNIPKAQLVIADIPYNIGTDFYASRPDWYVGGDNKNGESGSRPVLVMSNDVANHYSSTLTVIPMTTVMKKLELPTHVSVSESDCQMYSIQEIMEETGLGKASVNSYLPYTKGGLQAG